MLFRRPVVLTATLVLAAVAVLTGGSAAAGPVPAIAQPVLARPATAQPAARTVSAVPALVARTASAASAPATYAAKEATAALAKARPPCAVSARACVDLSARKAWITDGAGRIVYGPVSVLGGRTGEPTPVGTFSVRSKVRDYHSRQFDAPMPYSVFFSPGIAFHQGSLSTRSAGCLHLSRASAMAFFSELGPGDTVQVVG